MIDTISPCYSDAMPALPRYAFQISFPYGPVALTPATRQALLIMTGTVRNSPTVILVICRVIIGQCPILSLHRCLTDSVSVFSLRQVSHPRETYRLLPCHSGMQDQRPAQTC